MTEAYYINLFKPSINNKEECVKLKGLITEEEAKNMTYPHSKEYREDGGTVYYYREPEVGGSLPRVQNEEL